VRSLPRTLRARRRQPTSIVNNGSQTTSRQRTHGIDHQRRAQLYPHHGSRASKNKIIWPCPTCSNTDHRQWRIHNESRFLIANIHVRAQRDTELHGARPRTQRLYRLAALQMQGLRGDCVPAPRREGILGELGGGEGDLGSRILRGQSAAEMRSQRDGADSHRGAECSSPVADELRSDGFRGVWLC